MPTQHHGVPRSPYLARFTLADCNAILPLIHAIAGELIDRRDQFKRLRRQLQALQQAPTPEGLGTAIADLEARILEQEDGIAAACEELARYGVSVQRLNPLIVHFPSADSAESVFCWSERERCVAHRHSASEPVACTSIEHLDIPGPVVEADRFGGIEHLPSSLHVRPD
jgi:hypothetical protein